MLTLSIHSVAFNGVVAEDFLGFVAARGVRRVVVKLVVDAGVFSTAGVGTAGWLLYDRGLWRPFDTANADLRIRSQSGAFAWRDANASGVGASSEKRTFFEDCSFRDKGGKVCRGLQKLATRM